MRGLIVVATLLLPACFNPDYPEGLPCDPAGWCPPEQVCNPRNVCVSALDAGPIPDGSGNGADADDGLGELQSISIGDDVTIAVGQTHQFVVTGTYENGTQVIDDFAIWRSSDNAVMFIDFMGVAKGESEGTATARCEYDGKVDTALVTVTPVSP